jgi:hypothetical protein
VFADLFLYQQTHLSQPPTTGRRRADTDVQVGGCGGARAVPAWGQAAWTTFERRGPSWARKIYEVQARASVRAHPCRRPRAATAFLFERSILQHFESSQFCFHIEMN